MLILDILFIIILLLMPIYIIKGLYKEIKEKRWEDVIITILSYTISFLFFNWLFELHWI
jgi:hypothetical protein